MTRALRWVVLVAFAVDVLYLASVFWALTVSYNPFTTTGILLLVAWGVWLAVLVTALLAARRRHSARWLLTFGILGIIGIASTLLVLFEATTTPVFELYFNLLQPFFEDTVPRTIVGGLLLLLACLLPLPVAALWYGRRRVPDEFSR